MATENNKSNTWQWVVVALIVAALAVGVILYIGWFDNKTHVDSPNGDNVTQTYNNNDTKPDDPGQTEWQDLNSAKQIEKAVTDPTTPTATPPQGE